MKCFLCPLEGMILAVPAGPIERICAARDVSPPVFSLTELLPAPPGPVHAALLKNGRAVLLPEIRTERELPEGEIHPLPAVAAAKLFWIGGVWFDPEGRIVLLVDVERALQTEGPR